ncbi:hypothetical protein M885DRAFT_626781, partial [Pelagophyceae sp. CCMP2097]
MAFYFRRIGRLLLGPVVADKAHRDASDDDSGLVAGDDDAHDNFDGYANGNRGYDGYGNATRDHAFRRHPAATPRRETCFTDTYADGAQSVASRRGTLRSRDGDDFDYDDELQPALRTRCGIDSLPRHACDFEGDSNDRGWTEPLRRPAAAAPSRSLPYHTAHADLSTSQYARDGALRLPRAVDSAGDSDGAIALYATGAAVPDAADGVEPAISRGASACLPRGASVDDIKIFCNKVLSSDLERNALYEGLPPEMKALHSREHCGTLLKQLAFSTSDAVKGRNLSAVIATVFGSVLTTGSDGRGFGIVAAHVSHIMSICANSKIRPVADVNLVMKSGYGTFNTTCGGKKATAAYFDAAVVATSLHAAEVGRGITDVSNTASRWCSGPVKSLLQLLIESDVDLAWILQNMPFANEMPVAKKGVKRQRGGRDSGVSLRASAAEAFAASLSSAASTAVFDNAF